jgi:RimJ/RimL family protein N-acetyltransferase
MNSIDFPGELRTERLQLRRWRKEDAGHLLPVLEANIDHLSWIPAQVAAPAPMAEIERRLAGFAADWEAGRSWRFGVFAPDLEDVFGEISLFPRSTAGRVQLALADRLEVGYWLRADVTGRGYATEATRAMVSLASAVRGIRHIEIRCDPLNERSAAVPRRLGFRLATAEAQDVAHPGAAGEMIWVHELVVEFGFEV